MAETNPFLQAVQEMGVSAAQSALDAQAKTESEAKFDEALKSHLRAQDAARGIESDEPAAEQAAPVAPVTPAAEPADEEYAEALKALRRLPGLPKGLLDRIDRDTALAWAPALREQQRRVDDAFRELSELRKPKDPAPVANGKPQEKAPAAPVADVDLKALAKPLVEEFGEEVANAVVKMTEAAIAPLKQQLEEARSTARTAEAQAVSTQAEKALERTRERLARDLPALADDEVFGKVMARAARIAPGYVDMEGTPEDRIAAVLSDAAKLEGVAAATPTNPAGESAPAEPDRRAASVPLPPRQNSVAQDPRTLSFDERLKRAARAVEAGKSVEEARLIGGLT